VSVTLRWLRGSLLALALAVVAWAAGCATAPPPLVDPALSSGAYVPARIALLPPDVFVVLDQVGDNDPVRSAALGQAVSAETVRAVEQSLRARGYDVDLSARWDGIVGPDGRLLVSRDELGWLANGVLQFGNARAGQNPPLGPPYIAPELAAKVGWATGSDALLYVNVKGVATTSGKRAASIVAGVFIVFIVAAIVVLIALNSKSGGGSSPHPWSGGTPTSVARATPAAGGVWRGTPSLGGHAAAMPSGAMARSGGAASAIPTGGGFHGTPLGGGAAGAMPSGSGFHGSPAGGGAAGAMPTGGGFHGAPAGGGAASSMRAGNALARPVGAPAGGAWQGGPPAGGWRGGSPAGRPPGAYVYDPGPHIGFGVGVIIPLDGPVYTHDGDVQYDDPTFAGDELYVSMTLVSTSDGRVLWHARQELDLDADDPSDVDRMVESFVGSLPPRGGFPPAPPKH
jgi:hypothetical protein